jgi:hypothetical protein
LLRERKMQAGKNKKNKLFLRGNCTPSLKINISLSVMFAWQIYLFMTNSCDVKWKTIMGFLGDFSFRVRFGGYKSFGVKGIEICLKLMLFWLISRDMSLRKIAIRWPSFTTHAACVWLCLLALFQICKWTEEDKNLQKKAIYMLLC